MSTVGFVGLGTMGGRIARRLLDAGHTVTGYNRTPSRAQSLLQAGMRWAGSPRAVAEASDVTFTMVTNTAALQAVTEGPDGVLAGLGPGKVYVDMSTVRPAESRALAGRVGAAGAAMLDAPVSGSVVTLEEGRLSIMVGGDEATYRQIRPLLLDIGPRVTHVGGHGQAALMKIATNLSLAVQMVAFGEGLLLAEKNGISRETAAEVLLNSAIASPMLRYRGPFALQQPEVPWFDVDMMQKDMLLALEAGREADVPMPTTAVANELLTAARGMGLARYDFAVVVEVLARLGGLPGRLPEPAP